MRATGKIVLWVLMTALVAGADPPTVLSVAPDGFHTEAFHRRSGWTGADGTYSVPLPDGRTVWLFSDTLYGEVDRSGRRFPPLTMVHNSLAIQDGDDFHFQHGGGSGPPRSIFAPPDGRGFFWLYDALPPTEPDDAVTILLGQFEAGTEVFDFRQIGLWAARFRPGKEAPEVLGYTRLPHFRAGQRALSFGAALMPADRWTYIYGTADSGSHKELLLARVPSGRLEHAEDWQFFTGTEWSRDPLKASAIAKDVHNELSVHPAGNGYLLTTQTGGMGGPVSLAWAARPEGPYSDPVVIWETPENRGQVFSYNAKAHPERSPPGELLISYNVNTLDLRQVEVDADVYRPRFIRVRFGPTVRRLEWNMLPE